MQISSVSAAYGHNSSPAPIDLLRHNPASAGQNLPEAAQPAQFNSGGVVSSPRAGLTASATSVLSQSVDSAASRIDLLRQVAVYQSNMNAQGLYGYQSILGAPLNG